MPHFTLNNSKIHVLFDTSHVIKLLCDAVASERLLDAENKPIKWTYFQNLVKFGYRKNLRCMHKMTQAHIDFNLNPMKVVLAVQTLSASTANAIEYLMQEGFPEFRGAEQ